MAIPQTPVVAQVLRSTVSCSYQWILVVVALLLLGVESAGIGFQAEAMSDVALILTG